jgi:hypothetical protein
MQTEVRHMALDLIGASWRAWRDARPHRAFEPALGVSPLLVGAAICIAARGCIAWLPTARVELIVAAASVSAAISLVISWKRDANGIRSGVARAIVSATLCALGAFIDI